MPNVLFDMTSHAERDLERLLDIVCGNDRKAVGYAIRTTEPGLRWESDHLKDPSQTYVLGWRDKPKLARIVFFWTHRDTKDFVALPFKLDAKGIADFSLRWLAEEDYGEAPDTDGDSVRGWRAYCDRYGHVDSDWGAFLAVSPMWIIYSK